MLYYWRGRKPHRHLEVTLGTSGREKGKPIEVRTVLIEPGATFEPSAAELKAFQDLLEPYGASLRADPGTGPEEAPA
jgi:hypothetical protein